MRPEIGSVPIDYGFKWLSVSWALAKKNYGLALGVALTIAVVNYVATLIPVLGSVMATLFATILGAGQLIISKKWANSQAAEYSDLFHLLSNGELFSKFIPLLVAGGVLSLPATYLAFVRGSAASDGGKGILILSTLITSIISVVLLGFSSPQIIFGKRTFGETIGSNVTAILQNILPILVCAVLALILIVVSILFLILPFIFVALPLFTSVFYLSYATIFEGLDLSSAVRELETTNSTSQNHNTKK